MAADLAYFIKRETDQLIDLQIQTFRMQSSLSSDELLEFHMRAKRLQTLFSALDQINRSKGKVDLASAS
jgi:hypothetical protein